MAFFIGKYGMISKIGYNTVIRKLKYEENL